MKDELDEDLLIELEAAKLKTKGILNSINSQIDYQKSLTRLTCWTDSKGVGCGGSQRIKDTTYLQTHWYETPSGCTGGDIWHRGEGRWVCNCCRKENRLYNKPKVMDLKDLFAEILEVYED